MVQYVLFQPRFPSDRMVRDKPNRTIRKKKNASQQKQSPAPDEPATPQQVQSTEQNQDIAEKPLETLDWSQRRSLHLSDQQLETWCQVLGSCYYSCCHTGIRAKQRSGKYLGFAFKYHTVPVAYKNTTRGTIFSFTGK